MHENAFTQILIDCTFLPFPIHARSLFNFSLFLHSSHFWSSSPLLISMMRYTNSDAYIRLTYNEIIQQYCKGRISFVSSFLAISSMSSATSCI